LGGNHDARPNGTMTYFKDLTRCSAGPFSRLEPLLAVGWLAPRFDFPRGPVDRAMRDRLEAFFRDPWLPIVFLGSHVCRFCVQALGIDPARADRAPGQLPRGSANILIPDGDVVYVVPELILHYIDEHEYCPPSALADAVAACPPMGSSAYFRALMAAGGDMPAFVEESLADDGEP
jgi:hypothetical protein